MSSINDLSASIPTFSALPRRIWRRRLESCKLTSLEVLELYAEVDPEGMTHLAKLGKLRRSHTPDQAKRHRLREGPDGHETPPQWLQPVRHTLGAVYLASGRYADAERVYREDLAYWPGNGWSLSWGCADEVVRLANQIAS